MTKPQLKAKIKQLIKQGKPEFDRMIDKAISSQAIDPASYDDNFLLAKIVLSAVYGEMEYQYKPLNKEDQKTVTNLKIFL